MRGRPLLLPDADGRARPAARGCGMADGTTRLDFIGGMGDVRVRGTAIRTCSRRQSSAAASGAWSSRDICCRSRVAAQLTRRRCCATAGLERLKHVWLSVSGAIANENALKLDLPQARIRRTASLVFRGHNFAGRTMAMAEITDKPAYREGLPLRGFPLYVPFYDPNAIRTPIGAQLSERPRRAPGTAIPGQHRRHALRDGAGARAASTRRRASSSVALMERCKRAEVSRSGSTRCRPLRAPGELFAYRTHGLEDLRRRRDGGQDACRAAPLLFTKAYNPKPGLVAGTYAGASVGMAVGNAHHRAPGERGLPRARGPHRRAGRARRAALRVPAQAAAPRRGARRSGIGRHAGLRALRRLARRDVRGGAPHRLRRGPAALRRRRASRSKIRLRCLLPVNTTDEELEAAFAILEKALPRVAEERGLPC